MDYRYEDFTIDNYRKLIRLAKEKYAFISYDNCFELSCEKKILLRHDVDYSLKGAQLLATIEKEEEICSTYFVYSHSDGYNLFTNDSAKLLKSIVDNGHYIGLHLDCSYLLYEQGNNKENNFIKKEVENIMEITGKEISAISFHSPESSRMIDVKDDYICGYVNTYSKKIFDRYKYISDSNGYWRYERLQDVLEEEKFDYLQILLHPVWWQNKEILSPAERVYKYFQIEAEKKWENYVNFTRECGREVVGIESL